MVRTGARALILKGLLASSGLLPAASARPLPRIEAVSAELTAAVMAFYRTLGGRPDVLQRLRPGPWDLAFEDGLVVELDEELHFNRYRKLVLEADWSPTLPWRNDYLTFSSEREAQGLAAGKWGKRWTNASSEAMFGAADPPGILGPNGAPRWKQRALYDMMELICCIISTVGVIVAAWVPDHQWMRPRGKCGGGALARRRCCCAGHQGPCSRPTYVRQARVGRDFVYGVKDGDFDFATLRL